MYWKDRDLTEYDSIHNWLRFNYGKADYCENVACPGDSVRYDWALRFGCKYEGRRENFIKFCRICHSFQDRKMEWDTGLEKLTSS